MLSRLLGCPPSLQALGGCLRLLPRRYAALAGTSVGQPTIPVWKGVKLRDYQEECIESVLAYLKSGHKRLGISLATGSGKTVIFTQLIDRVQHRSKVAAQTLILVHRRELVEQAARHCANAYPSKTIEVEMGKSHASGVADITIASVPSMVSKGRMLKFDPSTFKLVLVDEAHHIVASSYMDILKYFRLLKENLTEDSPALVGVSATMSRFDGLRLSDAIDHIVYHRDYVDMIEDRWLSNVIFTTVQSKADLSRVRSGPSGDYQVGDLSRAVNNSETNEATVTSWRTRASGRKSTLVFCVDLTHVADLTSTFRQHGIHAKFVTGATPPMVRSERLESFRHGKFPVLLNCGVFTEGTDIPNIDCILLARPTKSRNLLVQMIGRGMRLYSDKENCHIIDMVASLATGITTTPTLFGLDPNSLLQEANVDEVKSLRERKEQETEREQRTLDGGRAPPSALSRRTLTFTDYDSVYDLIDDTSGEQHVRSISSLAWVTVGPTRFVLGIQDGSYVTIEGKPGQDPMSYSVSYTQKMSDEWRETSNTKSPFTRPREIATSSYFSDAVHAADTYALQKSTWRFLGTHQPWRKGPATEGQLAFLNKLRPVDDHLTVDRVTKGKAADMITKVKFGAKGWFNELEVQKRREERTQEKARRHESLRLREQVKVGPTTN